MKELFKKAIIDDKQLIVVMIGTIIVLAIKSGWLGLAAGLSVDALLIAASIAVEAWMLIAVPFLMKSMKQIGDKIQNGGR